MQPLVLKAKAYQELGNYGDAIGIYEQILGRNPKLAEISLSIAYIKEELGDVNGAVKTRNNGLGVNPKDANLLFQLGRLYQTTKQYELAINAYQSSIGRKANSHNVESLRMIGEIYYTKLTNEKKAVEYFKKYVKPGGKDNNVDYLIKKINGKG
jgi:tetratricopeptide (TPR) repeat protein